MGRHSEEEINLEGIELERYLAKKVLKEMAFSARKLKPYFEKIDAAETGIQVDHIRRDAIKKLL